MGSEAILLNMPALIKAFDYQGTRRFTVEVSCEEVDSEGDVILQKALLDSADSFVKNGIIDWNHYSELGLRMGIKNPEFYKIGRPVSVQDLGKGRTAVTGELFRSSLGHHDPKNNMADQVWDMLTRIPPTDLYASVYGFASDYDVGKAPATRYLVKGFRWTSFALTPSPVNKNLKGKAEIVTAKAFMNDFILKSEDATVPLVPESGYAPPRSREDLWGDYDLHCKHSCPYTKSGRSINVGTLRDHFEGCRGMLFGEADLMAHAAMHLARRMRERQY